MEEIRQEAPEEVEADVPEVVEPVVVEEAALVLNPAFSIAPNGLPAYGQQPANYLYNLHASNWHS